MITFRISMTCLQRQKTDLHASLPAVVMDREDSGAYLRILGLGSPFGMDVYVNRLYEDQAKQLIQEAFSQKEDLSEQELEELAMETHSDEV